MYSLILGCSCCSVSQPISLLPYTVRYKQYIPPSGLLEDAEPNDPNSFESNLPHDFLLFQIRPEIKNQLYRVMLSNEIKLRDVQSLFDRLCILLQHDSQNLLFRSDCIAPKWLKHHPLVIGKIYSSLFQPSIIEELIRASRLYIIPFAIWKGAPIPTKWNDWLGRTFPQMKEIMMLNSQV